VFIVVGASLRFTRNNTAANAATTVESWIGVVTMQKLFSGYWRKTLLLLLMVLLMITFVLLLLIIVSIGGGGGSIAFHVKHLEIFFHHLTSLIDRNRHVLVVARI